MEVTNDEAVLQGEKEMLCNKYNNKKKSKESKHREKKTHQRKFKYTS